MDVFLIDEPEVHLNWHLEEKLFHFFDQMCTRHEMQMIVVTHSRSIFRPQYRPRTQFMYWRDDGKIGWRNQLTSEQMKKLAGEAIEIIRLGNFSKPTFFVEDKSHEEILTALASLLNAEISISKCGNSPNVKSLFRHSKQEGGWQNAFFIVDGDNEGNPFRGEPSFVHLPVYCIENFFIHPDYISLAFGKTLEEIKDLLASILKEKRTDILNKNKFFEFLFDGLNGSHMIYESLTKLDASVIFDSLVGKLHQTRADYIRIYLEYLDDKSLLEVLFPNDLIKAIKSSILPIEHPTTTNEFNFNIPSGILENPSALPSLSLSIVFDIESPQAITEVIS